MADAEAICGQNTAAQARDILVVGEFRSVRNMRLTFGFAEDESNIPQSFLCVTTPFTLVDCPTTPYVYYTYNSV